jgi:flagellar biosynthesis protein FliR
LDLFDLLQNHAAVFLLLLTRVSGIFMLAPFFGSLNIPVYMRAGTALAISVVLFPVVDQTALIKAPETVLVYALAVLTELFVGWLIGFVAYISFSAIHMAGKIMDMQVGFSIVNVMDPTSGQQIPLIGSFLYNLGLIIFLVTNGHHMIIAALFESFRVVPLLGMTANPDLTMLIANFTGGIFSTGMKIAMPVTFAILLTNVALGVLARTMPQLNIFVVGVPMQIIVGVFVLSILVPFYIIFLDVLFNEMYGNISLALKLIQ